MLTTFRNAWKIEDLRKRIMYTILIVFLFRLGIAIPVPFIDTTKLADAFQLASNNLFSFFNHMNGGALASGSIFSLAVQPYIQASIIMQLLAVAIPALERLKKEGPEGQKKMNRITRIAGAAFAFIMGYGLYVTLWNSDALTYGMGSEMFPRIFTAAVILFSFVAGTMIVMWMGEQIDSKGIGNGISFIIFAGIISGTKGTVLSVYNYLALAKAGQPKYYILLPLVFILALAAVVMVVVLNAAERRIPVQYAKKMVGRKMYGGQSSNLPIKVNMSGVMPIIFASSITAIPSTITMFWEPKPGGFWSTIFDAIVPGGLVYALLYAVLIIAFNYFYVAITYNPIQMANDLKKSNAAIPGIRPGKPTSDFIAKTISKVTLIGAIFLVVVAVGPILLARMTGINMQLGGTSLLIVVGVALDTSRSLESFMLMRHHKGFLE